MHIHIVPNRNSKPAVLLRESFRKDGKVHKRTIANLSSLPPEQIEQIRLVLKGKNLAEVDKLFQKIESKHHGHVQAVLSVIDRLGLDKAISAKRCKERDIIVAVITARICEPDSKLAMTRWWNDTTLPELLGVEKVNEKDIYKAMDWLLKRQGRIEKKLAKRHLKEGDLVLYDITSSYFEGETCPLARRGKSRDRKRNTLQVNYGLVANREGCPVSVSVFEGNVGDSTTLIEQAKKVGDDFGIGEMVLVGDRGMISQKQIDELKDIDGMAWITALKTGAIRKLSKAGMLQMELFDERNLFEFTHKDFPGERLVACRNSALGRKRKHKRDSMINATVQALEKIRLQLERGTLRKEERSKERIGVRVGKVVNKYKMSKHIVLDIGDNRLDFEIDEESVKEESALDGIYIIRTCLKEEKMDAGEAVRSYKNLTNVERAFRSLKGIDLLVRPIRHRYEERVRAHIFISMLTYYVYHHMIEALRPLLFADENQEAKKTRDPVAPSKRSNSAKRKIETKKIDDGTTAHSFKTLLHHMSTITRDLCRQSSDADAKLFTVDTIPNTKQQQVLDLLTKISV